MTRPNSNTSNNGLFVDRAPIAYMIENANVPFFRPYVSTARPTAGPNNAVDANPVRNKRLTIDIEAGAPPNIFDAYTS